MKFAMYHTSCDDVKYMSVNNGFSDGKYFSLNIQSQIYNRVKYCVCVRDILGWNFYFSKSVLQNK